MTIFIETKYGYYYWTLKDKDGITNGWSTSLGNVFEQVMKEIIRLELTHK